MHTLHTFNIRKQIPYANPQRAFSTSTSSLFKSLKQLDILLVKAIVRNHAMIPIQEF